MSSSPAYLPLLSVWAFRRRRPNMPAADSCTAINAPCGPFSPDSRTPGRPPEVSTTAFTTHLPDLPPQPLMVGDFAIISSLVRPGRPHIWFLFVRSWLCYTLPSDPASRRRPCVSLILRPIRLDRGLTPPSCCACSAHQKKSVAAATLFYCFENEAPAQRPPAFGAPPERRPRTSFHTAPSATGTIAAPIPTSTITFRYCRMNGMLPKK